ncbi:DUF1501 domain-containing protein [Mycobacterium sp. URHB0044]|uniref:DUF1501 domain-containing protein n=1 Tax=Mycobacterium sp. URHB0044 TaxID=1380386 RepID=UPI000490582D|nr:DUF1501 domain-containing protein [Mycobacterium sp. URHB0044]
MAEFNRRKFLIAGAGVGAAGLLSGVVAVTLPDMLDAARDRPLPEDAGILVIVTLYGGNDGINTVIPYTNNAYHDSRPDLAYAEHEVLPLDGQLALNPALKGLAGMWKNRRLAIVRGVGYPKPDRSHFRSMDIWQTASPKDPVSTGWIGRWLDAGGDDPLRALNIGAVLPLMSIGEKQVASALSENIPRIPGGVATTLAALSEDDPHDTAAMSAVRDTYRAGMITEPEFGRVVKGIDPTAASSGPDEDSLQAQLDLVARCVRAGVPTRVYMVSLGGFDTHADERGTQEELLRELDEALTPFLRQMRTNTHGRNLVVMAYSEFGRRVAANASQGTDHGAAGPVFIAGGPVKGGFYGDEPSLTDLNDGDLKVTTDFRDIYHELLSHTLDSDPTPSIGPGRRDLGFL